MTDFNDAHSLGALLVPRASRVLVVGEGDGALAALLIERECRVWSIAPEEPARAGALAYERVVVGDVEQLALGEAFDDVRFDRILFPDVLSRVRGPAAVLRAASGVLDSDGRIVACIPNVTHAAVRLELLAGRFSDGDGGLLDRTRLRFFDRAGVEQLFADAGLAVEEWLRTVRAVDETELAVDPSAVAPEVLAQATAGLDADTYQFVVTAAPANRARDKNASLTAQLQARIHDLEQTVGERERHAESLEQQVREREALALRVTELEGELRARMDELHTRDEEIEYLGRDATLKEGQMVDLREKLADLRDECDSQRAQVARLQGLVDALQVQLDAPRHRLVDRANDALRRMPAVHRALRRLVRSR